MVIWRGLMMNRNIKNNRAQHMFTNGESTYRLFGSAPTPVAQGIIGWDISSFLRQRFSALLTYHIMQISSWFPGHWPRSCASMNTASSSHRKSSVQVSRKSWDVRGGCTTTVAKVFIGSGRWDLWVPFDDELYCTCLRPVLTPTQRLLSLLLGMPCTYYTTIPNSLNHIHPLDYYSKYRINLPSRQRVAGYLWMSYPRRSKTPHVGFPADDCPSHRVSPHVSKGECIM